MLGRALEALRGALPKPVIWFWFAPYPGRVTQTRDTLVEQCSSLRIRDIYTDREPGGSRDRALFILAVPADSHPRLASVFQGSRKSANIHASLGDIGGNPCADYS